MQATAVDISKNLAVNFATEANYFPFEYLDEFNKISGFDIDIAKAVCKKANLSCQFSSLKFDSLLLALQFGRFDAVISALDITEARKQIIDFSTPYYYVAPVFISTVDEKDQFVVIEKAIGVQANTSNHAYLIKYAQKNNFIISYPSSDKAFADLSYEAIDTVFADQAVAANFLLQGDNKSKFSVVKTEDEFLGDFSIGYGIAVKKGNARLLERINYGLAKIHEDGSYQKIFNQYFGY